MTEQTQPIAVINADAYWACLSTPNDLSGKYQIDLCNLSDGGCREAAQYGD